MHRLAFHLGDFLVHQKLDVFPAFVGTNKAARPTFLDQRGPVACFMIRATCSSRQAEPRRVRSDWRFSAARDPTQRVAALAQVTDFREHTLLAGIGLDVLAVRAETEPEPDIANPFPAGALVPQRVPSAWSTTLRSYLRSRSEYM